MVAAARLRRKNLRPAKQLVAPRDVRTTEKHLNNACIAQNVRPLLKKGIRINAAKYEWVRIYEFPVMRIMFVVCSILWKNKNKYIRMSTMRIQKAR